ncbi:hypothetical protein [Hymenobacter arcticus]
MAQVAANNQQCAAANARTGRSIAHFVCQNYRQPADVALLAQTRQIQARTQALIDTLHLLRPQLQSPAALAALANPLAEQLERYTAFIQHYTPEYVPGPHPLTAMAAEKGPRQAALGKLPLSAALATLTRLEAQLRRYEARALQGQAEKIGGKDGSFDTIGLQAVPAAETVAPGTEYQAYLFLAQFSHRDLCNMEMTANGVTLTQPSSPGMLVRFAVPARQPGQPDTVRAQWHGTIQGPLFPSDTTLQLTVPYLIVQHSGP